MLQMFWARLRAFIAPFHDPRAWTLIILCAGGVWLFDPVMARTVLEFVLIAGAFAGIAVMISRHVLPQVNLTAHVQQALTGPTGAGLVVLSVALFLSVLVLTLALWGRA